MNEKEPDSNLYQVLEIAQPTKWLILTTIVILVFAFLVWSFVGRIPTEVNGRGVALSSRGVFNIEAQANGVVSGIQIKEGQILDEKTLVMTIYNPILKSIISQIQSTQFKIGQLQKELEILKTSLQEKEDLFKKGLIAKTIVSDARSLVLNKEIAIQDAKSALLTHFSELEKNSACAREEIEGKISKFFEESDEEFLKLKSCLSEVYSPSAGKVLEILVKEGKHVEVREPLVWMEYPPTTEETIIFFSCVSLQEGGRIKKDMQVQIEPSTVNPQEYGSMLGIVTDVSPFAVSEKELLNTLHNTQLVNFLVGGAPAVLQIIVEPLKDKTTPSGYAWTSGKGPPFRISTGTIGTIRVIVEEQPPISYLIPLWRLKPTS